MNPLIAENVPSASEAPLRGLWRHIARRRRRQLLLLMVLMVCASLAEALSLGLTLPFLSALTSPEQIAQNRLGRMLMAAFDLQHPRDLLLPLSVGFGLAAALSGGMRTTLLWAQTKLAHSVGADLSAQMFERSLNQPYQTHLSRNSSETISGITDKSDSVVYHSLLPALAIVASIVLLLSIVTTLLLISPVASLSTLTIFGAAYLVIMVLTRKRLARNSLIISREAVHVLKILREGFAGIRDVLLDGSQETHCTDYRNASARLRRSAASVQIISGMPRFGIEAFAMLLIAVVAYLLVVDADGSTSAVPILGVLALGAQRILPLLQQLFSAWSSVMASRVTLQDAIGLLDQPLTAEAMQPPPPPMAFDHEIAVSHVKFQYPERSAPVFSDISLSIAKGAKVGFIGSTGSGKSTFIDLIMGLLPPTSGAILIDGVPLDRRNARAWQANIAHVPQSIFLADRSIAENIALGVPRDAIDLNSVRHAARLAQLAQTIESWEYQYDTLVGENGVRLSGGQRQRIGIARALYKKARVIVLDEATSALDSATEASVMNTIDGLGQDMTVLIIAHRLSTLQHCDLIFELAPLIGLRRILSFPELRAEGVTNER